MREDLNIPISIVIISKVRRTKFSMSGELLGVYLNRLDGLRHSQNKNAEFVGFEIRCLPRSVEFS